MSTTGRHDIVDRIESLRVGAIIRTDDQDLARQAMLAAVRGGFRMVEFTLTTPGALELIGEFADREDLLVGAGTVMSPEDAAAAVSAGARFLVSPVCDPEVIAAARKLDVASIPGTFTPTEMLTAHRCGADFVKLFPAPADPAQFVANILGPLPYLRIYPTAGVTPENFTAILEAGAAGVGFVKPLFEPADLARRDFDAIEKRAAGIIRQLAG